LLVYKVYSLTNDPSLGFFPLRRFKHGQRQTSGLPHPTLLRLQVFSTSWRFDSVRAPSALFRAESVPGVVAFRGFPLPEAATVFTALYPSCPPPRASTRLRGAGSLHLGDPFTTNQCYPVTSADPLLAFCPSEEFSPRVLALHFSKASSHGLSHNAR